jgi:hypothetical protein
LLAGQDMAILEEARDRVSRASQGEMRMVIMGKQE